MTPILLAAKLRHDCGDDVFIPRAIAEFYGVNRPDDEVVDNDGNEIEDEDELRKYHDAQDQLNEQEYD